MVEECALSTVTSFIELQQPKSYSAGWGGAAAGGIYRVVVSQNSRPSQGKSRKRSSKVAEDEDSLSSCDEDSWNGTYSCSEFYGTLLIPGLNSVICSNTTRTVDELEAYHGLYKDRWSLRDWQQKYEYCGYDHGWYKPDAW